MDTVLTSKTKNKTYSLRSKLIFAFLLFTVICIVILWVFETVFLNDFYKQMKIVSTEKCSDRIVESIGRFSEDSKLDEEITQLSRKYSSCISIYKISHGKGKIITERHVNALCFIHNLRDSGLITSIYNECSSSGGKSRKIISASDMIGEDYSDDQSANVIFSRIISFGDTELFIIVNSELVPLSSTIQTIRIMLIIISIVLAAIAVLLAVILSKRISKPIKSMSEEAVKLSLGDYTADFDGGNCTETTLLSSALNNATYELSKTDRMQKDLVANVSHDLRTPLTMISGYAEVMKDIPGEATEENLQIIIDETNRLSDLVTDMMEISKYQSGTPVLKKTVFNFTEVIRKTLERYSKLRETEGYRISFDHSEEVYVNADEGKILQVVYNLINNAINYTGDDKCIYITQETDGRSVKLSIRDTGDGIREEDLPRVWERYYKVHDFHKRGNTGTGLGLSIVKNILLLHEAQFGVDSTVGKGSTFWFSLDTADIS